MMTATSQFANIRDKYETRWSSHAKRLDARVKLMHTLKQGIELVLLTCAFLAYYLIDCMVQANTLV